MQPVTTIGLDICQVGCQWSSRVRTRRQKMGWLYLGRHKGRGLMYAGKVDHGFDTASAKDLQARLRPLIRKTRPYSKKITHRGIWVEPLPLAEIEYRVKSAEGKTFFKGVREDL